MNGRLKVGSMFSIVPQSNKKVSNQHEYASLRMVLRARVSFLTNRPRTLEKNFLGNWLEFLNFPVAVSPLENSAGRCVNKERIIHIRY